MEVCSRNLKVTLGGIDIVKFLFACLIPLLHISFENSSGIHIVQQYVSRMGVPFFFSSSGMFLIISIKRNGPLFALKKYAKRIGILLVSWLIIYSPILLYFFKKDTNIIQNILFKTPAYLWYLTALLFAIVPFCLVKNRKMLMIIAAFLYFVGTLIGGSYSWITGGWPLYEKLFLTTRNGLFFGLPLLCVGEIVANIKQEYSKAAVIISLFLLVTEITIVQWNVLPNADCSMYFMMPIFIFFFMCELARIKINLNTVPLRGVSTAIYVIQYGVITIFTKIVYILKFPMSICAFIIWFIVIISGFLLYRITDKVHCISFLV